MKEKLLLLLIVPFIFMGCDKKETLVPVDLKGTLKGHVITEDEFGQKIEDQDNVIIRLEGSEPLLQTTTDVSGNFQIDNIPFGTYNIVVEKDGYATKQGQGFQMVGGDKPLFRYYEISKASTSTIENLQIEDISGTDILVSCKVNHNLPDTTGSGFLQHILYFLHSEENPSSTNYLITEVSYFGGTSGGTEEARLSFRSISNLLSDKKLYIIAYAKPLGHWGYYDTSLGKWIYTGLSQPSNIASITIP